MDLRLAIYDLRAAKHMSRQSQFVNRKLNTVRSCRNPISFQIRLKRLRNQHAAIGLLVRFDERDEQPRQRRAAAVEDVWKFIFARLRLETQIHPPRLKILAVRAARNFEIAPLPRCQELDVVSLRAANTHDAGAKHD